MYTLEFHGTLGFECKFEDGGEEIVRRPPKISIVTRNSTGEIVRIFITTIHSIALKTLSNMFLKSGALDIKLEASEEKKARMIRIAEHTASFETGARLTGLWVSSRRLICSLNSRLESSPNSEERRGKRRRRR